MKPINIKLIIFALFLFLNKILTAQDFNFVPTNPDIGTVYNGDQVTITFDIVYNLSSYHEYYIDVWTIQSQHPWVTTVIPDGTFALTYNGEWKTITLSGIMNENNGTGFMTVVFLNAETQEEEGVQWINWWNAGSGGIEDYIHIEDAETTFSEQDLLNYYAVFYDMEPFGDEMEDWNLKIKLYSTSGGEFIYYNEDQDCCGSDAGWQFFAPELPSNISFVRNELGQIKGNLKISGLDNDGFTHFAELEIAINKEPDIPLLYTIPYCNNTAEIFLNASGGVNNFLYYDVDSGEPYNGTGLVQGNSPINVGNVFPFVISGLQECTKYYFAAKASNAYGTSDFSIEKSFYTFSSPNLLPIRYHFDDCSFPVDFTLEDNHYFIGDLIIESGATVTMTGGFMYFEANSKIIIEPGGKLILNGTTCTAPCGQTWTGIEVWGDSDEHQYTIEGECLQGVLELNGATIENADIAINLWQQGDWEKTGGIVKATDANLRNNNLAVQFMSYHNHSPFTGLETDNLSFFKNCNFEINTDYFHPLDFAKHVYMFDVKGIKFRGCTFVNNKDEEPTGDAIFTQNAGYVIEAVCNSQTLPCPEPDLDKCTFTGFHKAISATNTINLYSIYVKEAVFNENVYGIRLNIVDKATLIKNIFYVGTGGNCDFQYGIGIELNRCNGYAIEENKFFGGSGIGTQFIGTRVYYPRGFEVKTNEIYNNEYNGLYTGNLAEGENHGSVNPWDGLNYKCNKNGITIDNIYDFFITGTGIASQQGYSTLPAGNVFTKNFSPVGSDFNNQAIWSVNYYYNNAYSNQNPENTVNVFKGGTSSINRCLSHYGGDPHQQNDGRGLTGDEKQYFEEEFVNNSGNLTSVKTLFSSLKDGGNTEAMYTEIVTSWPQDMWELRSKLLGESPHLSKEILMTAADKTDVLPDAVIFEILSANPDELKDEQLMKYLEDKNNPLPQYMIDILYALRGGVTYKTMLQNQMSYYNDVKTQAANTIIRNAVNDTVLNINEVRDWLDNLQDLSSDYQIVDLYIQQGNTEDAISLLNMIPQLYNLQGEDLTEHNRYKSIKELQTSLKNDDRNIFMMTIDEKNMLEEIENSSDGLAGIVARNILEFINGGEQFCDCPDLNGDGLKNSILSKKNSSNSFSEVTIEAYPNPAKEWTAFEYFLPIASDKSTIVISDSKGQKIESIELMGNMGEVIWDTREIEPGVYFYILKNNNISKSGKVVITK